MNRQDIKTMIDRLLQISVEEYTVEDSNAIDRAISLLEELGNTVENLKKDILSLKQEILQLEAMIED